MSAHHVTDKQKCPRVYFAFASCTAVCRCTFRTEVVILGAESCSPSTYISCYSCRINLFYAEFYGLVLEYCDMRIMSFLSVRYLQYTGSQYLHRLHFYVLKRTT
jgi:hypothetical protein